jgi:hypothetical protein
MHVSEQARGSDVAMKFSVAPSVVLLSFFGCVFAPALGCAVEGQSEFLSNARGSISLDLKVAQGVDIVALDYQISGNGLTKTGSFDMSQATGFRFSLGGLPAGSGYELKLVGSDGAGGGVRCEGAAKFDVRPGKITSLKVNLRCHVVGNGGVDVEGSVNVCPVLDGVSALPAEVAVGGTVALSAAVRDLDAKPNPVTLEWTTTSGTFSSTSGSETNFTCAAPGSVKVTLTATDGDCQESLDTTVTCTSADPAEKAELVINEVESNGGSPDDWVELTNLGTGSAELTGYTFRDNDDTHIYSVPSGTSLAPGAFLVLEGFGFGLGSGDAARLFDAAGALVTSYTWTSHATSTYGRCPDGSGALVTTRASTKGTANSCPLDPNVLTPWPGSNDVTAVDPTNTFPENLSGLHYEPSGPLNATPVLWAALNSPSKVYRLAWNGTEWAPEAGDWAQGKGIVYPDGTGHPDTESITRAAWNEVGLYVSTERNNDANQVSRLSILRFDETASGSELVATHEWNLTAQLPAVGANLGLEAITWIPDSMLTGAGFFDSLKNKAYAPADYADHGTGLFVVGVEGTGMLHVVALNHALSTVDIVASMPSGQAAIMGLEWDRDTNALWAYCDNTCGNQATILAVDASSGSANLGRFVQKAKFAAPTGLPNSNNEGIALLPEASCEGGQKGVFWSDDSNASSHAVRLGEVSCGSLF